jgi:hypothetical protein
MFLMRSHVPRIPTVVLIRKHSLLPDSEKALLEGFERREWFDEKNVSSRINATMKLILEQWPEGAAKPVARP